VGPFVATPDRLLTRVAELFQTLWSKRVTVRAQAMAVIVSTAVRRSTDQGNDVERPYWLQQNHSKTKFTLD